MRNNKNPKKEKTNREKTQQKIKEVSNNLITTLGNLFLAMIYLGSASGSYAQIMEEVELIMGGHNPKVLKETFFKLRSDGFIRKNNQLTEIGWQRIKGFIPQYQKERNWDGLWRLVIFDIPENIRYKRNILRQKLKDLGFGRLQASVWISPYDFQEIVEKVIDFYFLNRFVVWFESKDLTMGKSLKDFTWRVWRLDKLNKEYGDFLKLLEDKKTVNFFKTSAYLSILKRDPQLPFELLSDNWLGDIAFKEASKVLKIEV